MGRFTYEELKAVEWFTGGHALMTSGLFEEAVEAYTNAIELDPNLAGFYTMRGYVYSKVEKFREALEDLNKAIQLDPEDAQNYKMRGAVLGIMGNQALALANIKVAAQMGEAEAQALLRREGIEWQDSIFPEDERGAMPIEGLEPIGNMDAKILILGTFPGEESLRQEQYYAHPRNLFWDFMGCICGAGRDKDYKVRRRILQERDICVWDILKSCAREGSLDTRIRNGRINDFGAFFARSHVEAVFFNGRKAEALFIRQVKPELNVLPPTMEWLPSTSPANARMTKTEKISMWCKIKQYLK